MEQKPDYKWQLARISQRNGIEGAGRYVYVELKAPEFAGFYTSDYNYDEYASCYVTALKPTAEDLSRGVDKVIVKQSLVELLGHLAVEVEFITSDDWLNGKEFSIPEEFKCRQ